MSIINPYISILALCLFLTNAGIASEIADNPDAIVVKDHTIFEIISAEKALTTRDYIYQLNNNKARHLRDIVIQYDQFRTIKKAEVHILDMLGNEIDKFKLKDFNDISLVGGSTASDGRLKLLRIKYNRYPFQLKVSYETEKSGSLHYPQWAPQPREDMQINKAGFTVIDRPGNAFRFKAYNVPLVQLSNSAEGYKIYKWQLNNIAPFQYESYNRNDEEYQPIIYTAPNKFMIEGHKGDMSSWNSFGKWISALNEGKSDLIGEELKSLDQQIAQASSDLEKAKLVYNYLQTNTHYVSIQLGIGGWQPFNASYVQKKNYGDCKALSFFTKSLLERYNIKSYYTIITAGPYAPDVLIDFPNAHFNHAILGVPIEQDTIFLECTSQTNPFGYQSKFTSNRHALMITEDGGKLIKTKKYMPDENRQVSVVKLNIGKTGAAAIEINLRLSGLEIENDGFNYAVRKSASEQKKWLKDNYKWSQATLDSLYFYPMTEGVIPESGFSAKLTNYKGIKTMGKRYFVNPGDFIMQYLNKPEEDERTKPIRIKYGYTQVDSIVYQLPDYLTVEKSINTVNITTEFGSYYLEVSKLNDQVTYSRKMILNDGVYSKEKYEDFKGFIEQVLKNDRKRIVLIDKT